MSSSYLLVKVLVVVLSISCAHSWIDGSPLGCRVSTLSKGKDIEFDNKCSNGSVSWSYPKFPDQLKLKWAPSVTKAFQVCLAPSSMMGKISCEIPSNVEERLGQSVDLSPLTAKDPENVCMDSDGGVVRLYCRGDDWTYVQVIDFIIKL